jgi:uncharacterized protein
MGSRPPPTAEPDPAASIPAAGPARLPPEASSEDALAGWLRGFGPIGVLSILAILAGNLLVVPLSAVLVLLWVQRSHTPWRAIGYVPAGNWVASVLVGIFFGGALKLLMKAVVMPLLGAPAQNAAYQHLVGNAAALPGMLYLIIVGAGFGEETLFRGYLFERLGGLLGTGAWAKAATVLITSGLFALAHHPEQGLPGVQQALVVGLVFGTVFAITGRIWMLMVAHIAFDLVAVAIIYWNLEATVAHLVFP